MRLRDRFLITRPLEQMETALVRAAIARPSLVDAHEEAILRTALSLARLYAVNHEGREVRVGATLTAFRDELARRLGPVLLNESRPPTRESLMPHLRELKVRTLAMRDAVVARFATRLPAEAIDQELRRKALVLVMGGGGGTAYVHLGVLSLLDEYGLAPSLMVGTSMGAIMSLFRSRMRRFEQDDIVNIVRTLSWQKLFRAVSTENRYGPPAALRLHLRSGIGRWFGADSAGGEAVRLSQLPIKTIIAVSGIRRGKLPHPLEFYERLISASPRQLFNPKILPKWVAALWEFTSRPDILTKVHLGADDETADFDAIDAAGFSSALPGIIHYDVLREDPRMHTMLGALMESRRIARFIDGGLVDNVPSKAAWRAVHKGHIQTRNAFILALNGFSPRLSTPLWLPIQHLAELNVARSRPYAHLTHDYRRTLGALTVVPSVEQLLDAVDSGRRELIAEVPFLTRMLAPLPRIG